MRKILLLGAFSSLLAIAAVAPVYRWIDQAGNVHYSDRAPPGQETEAVEILPGPPANEVAAARERLARLQTELAEAENRRTESQEHARIERELAETQRVERLSRCTLAQQNLHILSLRVPVYSIDASGKRVYIDDEQRAAEVKRLEAERAETCK